MSALAGIFIGVSFTLVFSGHILGAVAILTLSTILLKGY